MIIFENKGFQTISTFPDTDWTEGIEGVEKVIFVVHDDSEIASKVIDFYPNYDFVLNKKGELVDVVQIEPIDTRTEEQKQTDLKAEYNALSIEYIRQKYSADDENQILREYLAYGSMLNTRHKDEFSTYNEYVESCKKAAHVDVYGE